MANLILPSRFTQQPQYPVELNQQNWVVQKGIYLYNPMGTVPAASSRGTILSTSDAVARLVDPTAPGGGIVGSHSSSNVQYLNLAAPAYPFTIIGWGRSTSASSSQYLAGFGNGATHICSLAWAGNIGGDPIRAIVGDGIASSASSPTGYSINVWAMGAAKFTSNASRQASINGRAFGSAETTARNPTLDRFYIGTSTAGSVAFAGRSAHVMVLPWAVTDAEIAEIYREQRENPWQFFKKRPQILYFDVGGGGATGTLTSTLDGVTTSFSGTTTVLGTLGVTLDNVIAAFLGSPIVNGSISNTLEPATTAFEGSIGSAVAGDIASTLESHTTSLVGSPIVVGSIANQLEDITTSLTGTITIKGTLTSPLDDFITSLEGVVESDEISGTITVSLQDVTTALTGTSTVSGSITITLDAVNSSMAGTTTVVGTIANQLQDVTSYFTGFPGAEGFIARLRTLLGCGT